MRGTKIGNWEIHEVLPDGRVDVICTGCYVYTKVARVARLKQSRTVLVESVMQNVVRKYEAIGRFPNEKVQALAQNGINKGITC